MTCGGGGVFASKPRSGLCGAYGPLREAGQKPRCDKALERS
jgi:hypothetical protein